MANAMNSNAVLDELLRQGTFRDFTMRRSEK
jgi:hypothetical protein